MSNVGKGKKEVMEKKLDEHDIAVKANTNIPGSIQEWEFLNKSHGNLLWDIIDKSKECATFDASKQAVELCNLLSVLSDEDYNSVELHWRNVGKCIESNPYFILLHASRGGLVNGSDDSFYMDFKNWIIAQGKELCDSFFRNGHTVILNYIESNALDEDEYRYECMLYCFNRE